MLACLFFDSGCFFKTSTRVVFCSLGEDLSHALALTSKDVRCLLYALFFGFFRNTLLNSGGGVQFVLMELQVKTVELLKYAKTSPPDPNPGESGPGINEALLPSVTQCMQRNCRGIQN